MDDDECSFVSVMVMSPCSRKRGEYTRRLRGTCRLHPLSYTPGAKQRSYPMRGFGNFDAASRFCRAFDEQRQYFRLRTTMCQRVPPLAEQRREYCARFQALMGELMAA
ncbi:MAG: hypothetical protein M3R24_18885, partial [Chloroflexota bacterium]|nr:hypothetical protein [Chloroflexota bacterium]